MVNVFGESVGSRSGNLQMVKKVVTTVGQFKNYYDEIQQSYELGFTPYRLHTNTDGTLVTPIRTYDWDGDVMDDVATMMLPTDILQRIHYVVNWYIPYGHYSLRFPMNPLQLALLVYMTES